MMYKCAETGKDRWIEAAKACPYATYFHTPYWYDLIAPKQEYTALEVTFDDGASAVVPIAKIKRAYGLLTDNFSSPGGTYGGWVSTSVLNEKHILMLMELLTSKKNLTFRINPFDKTLISLLTQLEQSTPVIPSSSGITIKDDHTYIIDLTKGIGTLRGGISKGHKSAITFAERNGVTVKQAEEYDEWVRYYDVYTDSVKRWCAGQMKPRNVYPLTLFKRIYENRTGNEILWIAMKDGKPVAGTLIFYCGKHAVTWHGAALKEYFDYRPNNLLYWKIFEDAVQRGYEIFDFNPSGGHTRVDSFKKHFGALRLQSPVLQTKTPLRSLISKLRANRIH